MEFWIFLGIGVLFGATAMYLLLRQGKKIGLSATMQNFVLFCFITMFSLILALWEKANFFLPVAQIFGLVVSGLIFSWMGNKWSLEAMRRAPNPGYSLAITKSYAVTTYLLSPMFFSSNITWLGLTAVIVIIFFSSIVGWDEMKNGSSKGQKGWLLLSIMSLLAFGLYSLVNVYYKMQGVATSILLFYVCFSVSIGMALELWRKKEYKNISYNGYTNLFLTAVASLIFNWCLITGYTYAPNPGIMNAVNAGSVALTAVFSWLIFRDELNCYKLFGMVGVAGGLTLLIFS